jgi:hypothetical protein
LPTMGKMMVVRKGIGTRSCLLASACHKHHRCNARHRFSCAAALLKSASVLPGMRNVAKGWMVRSCVAQWHVATQTDDNKLGGC